MRTKSIRCTRHTCPQLGKGKQSCDRNDQYFSSLSESEEYTCEHNKAQNERD